MIYDETFPVYAGRAMRFTAVIAAAFAAGASYWGWQMGAGVLLGALFQLLFLWFLRSKYIKWSEEGRPPEKIGRRLVAYTCPERFFNVGICEQNMVAMAAGMAVVGFLAGLLSLTAATIADKVVGVIKE